MRPLLLLSLAVVVGASGGTAEAASLALTEAEKGRAVTLGQRSVTTESAFDAEWRVTNESGETATVLTPFHRVVLAARHAAFKNEPLKASEPDKIVRDAKDRLTFWVQLRGTREDFARHYAPRLVVGDREIPPSFVQNERTAIRHDAGGFLARCVYGFSVKEITDTSRVTLVVRDTEQRDVSRFAIDLAAMR